MNSHSLRQILFESVKHILAGAILFVVIALIAIALSEFVAYLDAKHYNPYIIKGLAGFEYFIFGLDLILAAIFLIRTLYKFVREVLC